MRDLRNDDRVSAPARFGRYRVERRIGSGAFATVWLAQDEVLDAPVAVKVLADNWAHRMDIRSRFEEEARILRRADSDRVVRVHDIGELEDGRPYFVMTYADRGTLADRISSGPVSLAEALRYGADIARGLAVLHRVGVIHRDVNPGNVLLRSGHEGAPERVLIADLGLAKAAARGSGFTLTVGTPGYTAPEQAKPGERGLDKRADVYSIGAVLHHMLTGTAPEQDVPPLPARDLNPDVPEPVDEVVRQALAVRPEDRFPSAGALADALDAAALRAQEAPAWRGHPRPPLPPSLLSRPPLSRPDPVPEADPVVAEAAPVEPPGRGEPDPREPDAERLASLPERPPERDDTLTIPWPAPRRRSRRRVLLALVGVLLLVAGGGTALVVRQLSSVEVVSADGAVHLTVPAAWGDQQLRSDWDLSPYGISGGSGTGLVVSSDAAGWSSPDSNLPGVFAGRAEGVRADELLARSVSAGCPAGGVSQIASSGMEGELVRKLCPGASSAYVEAWLQPPGRNFIIYVQVREPASADDANRVIRSLSIDWG